MSILHLHIIIINNQLKMNVISASKPQAIIRCRIITFYSGII